MATPFLCFGLLTVQVNNHLKFPQQTQRGETPKETNVTDSLFGVLRMRALSHTHAHFPTVSGY